MTYCLGMLCRTGAVFLSDSRTSAGMDNITMRSKMRVYEKPGERVICIMTSGNLSLTQATLALIDDDLILANNEPAIETILTKISSELSKLFEEEGFECQVRYLLFLEHVWFPDEGKE